ncbi:FG-GAP-like repeat-containing protein [uncultured Aquimarina sp.]|uniref:FG-GAP-like repeat-containing protein n=1 Tax=uncultured Aquimarina sp. TaxID=575652 RepID=UPI00262831DC|nr:FG-GAP-like repeat-containing protein [uncultured Aquimarina sp.]
MKKIVLLNLIFLNITYHSNCQSFENQNIPDMTTTLSASRSANFVDVNNDGWDDIFFSNGRSGGQNNMLYINNADGTFTTVTGDDIVSDNSSSDGTSFADADNDGDLDAFMVTWASSPNGINYFYRNNADGTFTLEPNNVSGILSTFSEMITWVDINNDQLLDIYFTNSAGAAANRYYENQGDGSFLPVTNLAITGEILGTRSVDWIDYDNDGDCDLFLTNENNARNSLFRNDGVDSFTQITNLSIVQDFRNSGGSSWGDIDNDGDYDLFVANYNNQNNQLFINDGGTFIEQTSSVIASGGGFSFGSSFADFDNDGDLDLLVCNAFLTGQQNNFVYINDGQGNFTQDTTSALALQTGWTFGCAFGDYNNDGWLDVILANTLNEAQTNSLFKNTGSGNNWVKFNCIGTTSNKSAIGATVKIRATINGTEVWQTRKITSSSGYNSQNSYAVHFGLGDATIIDELEITWPVGDVERLTDLTVNTNYTLTESSILSVSEFERFNAYIKIFPNPIGDKLHITIDESFLNKGDSNYDFILFDSLGKKTKIFKNLKKEALTDNTYLDISSLQSGTYFYELKPHNSNNSARGKVIKK